MNVRSIDEIVDEFHLEDFDLLKIDVEGFEPQVFVGACLAIQRYSPFLLCEFDFVMIRRAGGSPIEFAAQLFAYGTVFEISERNQSLQPVSESDCARLRNSNLLVVPPNRVVPPGAPISSPPGRWGVGSTRSESVRASV